MQDRLFFASLCCWAPKLHQVQDVFFFFSSLLFIYLFFRNSISLQGREEASLYWLDSKANQEAPANGGCRAGCSIGGGAPEEQLGALAEGVELGDAGALERLRSD